MNYFNYYLEAWKKYAVFKGRAKRKEYWYFFLINILVNIVLSIIDDSGSLGTIYGLAVLIPSLAVTVRRLHDIDKRGSWIFIGFIPVVGAIMLIVFLARASQPGDNKYGPGTQVAEGPKEDTATVA